jgi:hypothetical protein
MSQTHETIDVRTLEDVHRLLASTDFATADQLGARAGSALATATRPATVASAPNASSEGLDPLPRRR